MAEDFLNCLDWRRISANFFAPVGLSSPKMKHFTLAMSHVF
jgi:hypothetical protein